MLLSLLKWAYRRGVLTERARIKNLLLQYRRDNYGLLSVRPMAGDFDNEKDYRAGMRGYEIQREAMDIVNNLKDYRAGMRGYEIQREAMDIVNNLLEPRAAELHTPSPIDSEDIDPRAL